MADDFLAVFDFGDDADGADTPGETVEERHGREKRELMERIKEMMIGSPKGERPRVQAEVEQLNAELKDRHAREKPEAEGLAQDVTGLKIGSRSKAVKAKQRRKKKAQEEAEREARIAEAQKNAGPDKREIEVNAIATQLEPLGLCIHNIPADGHCLFRSVAWQLSGQADTSEAAAWDLRRKAVRHMEAHVADFAPFFEPTDSAPTFEAYCEEMRSTPSWGGQMELRALGQVLGTKIRVHTAGAPPLVMNEEAASGPIELVFQQHAYGLGEHYNAAAPLQRD